MNPINNEFPARILRDQRLAYEASKKSQAEAKAKTAMRDELMRVMETTRNEYLSKESA